jgi:hypothetical protein
MTPEQARAHLRAHAQWLRDEIDRRKIELSAISEVTRTILKMKAESLPEIERLEYIATGFERFAERKAESLDAAFELERREPGAPLKDKERMALARKVFHLERRGVLENPSRPGRRLPWQVSTAQASRGGESIETKLAALGELTDKIDIGTIRRAYNDFVDDLIAEELTASLAKEMNSHLRKTRRKQRADVMRRVKSLRR